MKYSGIIYNDLAAAPGVCLSFFVQGCHAHCEGCHNPETWDFNGGKELTSQVFEDVINGINKNGIMRPLCIMGGEPLCDENLFVTSNIINEVKKVYPNLPIYLWTGYYYEDLIKEDNPHVINILNLVDILIDGPFKIAQRDITLKMRGSKNQRIINLKELKG